jgi:hypothetical protein
VEPIGAEENQPQNVHIAVLMFIIMLPNDNDIR